MAISVRNEGAKVNSNINVTPMVDVMLVLLIIFMVITPMLQKGTIVEMAKTNNPVQMPDADKEDALLVAVNRDGKVFFDSQIVSPEELTQKVKERVSSRTNKQVFVRADARAHYKWVVDVVDDVRSAGVDQLGLLTEQRQNPKQATTVTRAGKRNTFMAMTTGGGGGQTADINVTPLIDVLAGAADYLYGDHAAYPQRTGGAGTTASAATPAGNQY